MNRICVLAGFLFVAFASVFGGVADELVFVECESFDTLGGWVVDPQFMDEMGSPFLLAHGLGQPVDDAVTTVKFDRIGYYRVWVRTRDWVAPWKKADTPKSKRAYGTPGKFQVMIDGEALKTTFGVKGDQWSWHDGGVATICKKEIKLSLHDLTGFEGRCDAVLFRRKRNAGPFSTIVPPSKLDELTAFRRKLLGTEKITDAGEYDLVVVGGGIAGTCAAVSGARNGLKVALVQDRPVLGGNNSSEVRVWLQGARSKEPWPRVGDVVAELEHSRYAHYGPSNTAALYEDDKKLAVVRGEANIKLFLEHRGNGVEMEGKRIRAVIAEDIHTGKRIRLKGRWFADCTGDACIGALAGADFQMQQKDKMGPCNLWNVCECADTNALNTGTVKATKDAPFPRCRWALDLSDKPFPGRSKSKPDANKLGGWYWESGFDRDPIAEKEYVRDWNFRAMYGAWDAMKNVDKVLPNYRLNWSAYILGKRESRRLLGDVILGVDDLMGDRKFADGCFPTGWSNDLHLPESKYEKGFEGDAFISRAVHGKFPAYKENRPFWIPYRSLYSRNIDNLFMAGRCISVTHDALGAVRVMRTGGTGGEIVGMAASVCKEFDTDPRGVYKKHLADLQKRMRKGAGKVDGSTIPYKNQGERGHTFKQALAQPKWLKLAGKNLARMAKVSTNKGKTGGVDQAILVNDGYGKVTSNSGRWLGRGVMPHIVEFKWDKPVEIGAGRIISGRTNGVHIFDPLSDFKIQHYNGKTWKDVHKVKGNVNPAWAARFAPVKTKYLRLVVTRAPHNISRVWEVEFYGPVKDGEDMPTKAARRTSKSKRGKQKILPPNAKILQVAGHTGYLALPEGVKAGQKTPWLWYCPSDYNLPGKLEQWMMNKCLANGIAVAGINLMGDFGTPAGRAVFTAFYKELISNHGLTKKVCMLARSYGGTQMYNWAAEHPESVACLAGIYPVCNLQSYPGLKSAAGKYRMKEEQFTKELKRHNPIDRLAPLAKWKVPIYHNTGNIDTLVPPKDNSFLVEKRYKALGGDITVTIFKGQGHNYWPGFFEDEAMAAFIIKHAKRVASLPRVLFFGDSIHGGYHRKLIELMNNKAEMVKLGTVPTYTINNAFWRARRVSKAMDFNSAKSCVSGLERLKKHLAENKYDLVHFNYGLNDIFRGREGTWYNPVDQYAKDLAKIVALLKKNGAKIIWSNTTPIPDNDKYRPVGDELIHNAAAAKVMKENNIPINDLHSVVTGWDGYDKWKQGDNVHFSGKVYAMLAEQVAEAISAQIKTPDIKKTGADTLNSPAKRVANLPRVLFFGDSISGGYSKSLIKLMEGKAEMVKLGAVAGYRIKKQPLWQGRPAGYLNFGNAMMCVSDFDRFKRHLDETKYDVIHFNFGLNDIFRGRNGKWHSSPEEYAEHLSKIIALLKTNGAKIIWANTTPIPANAPHNPEGEELIYNAAAEKVMKKNNIPINDLHSVVINWDGYAEWKKGDNVHFSGAVYLKLAKQIAEKISEQVKANEAGSDSFNSPLIINEYAPGNDPVRFKLCTHICFNNGEEIVTDLKNDRFVYRSSPADPFSISPVEIKGAHSIIYNHFDGLYYACDTENNRIIAFADLNSKVITASTSQIDGIDLVRPHDIILDPDTGWLYTINPNKPVVFRFKSIGVDESSLTLSLGYSRALTLVNGKLYVIASSRGEIVEIKDFSTAAYKKYTSFGHKRNSPAGSWDHTGLIINDVEYCKGYWYATSFFCKQYAKGYDTEVNKFIRFKNWADFESGNWEDLTEMLPANVVPYYLTVHDDALYLPVFNHGNLGQNDKVYKISF